MTLAGQNWMLMLFFFPPGDQGSASLNGIRLSLKTGKSRAWLLVYVVYSNRNVLSGDLFYVELETVTQLTSADRSMARRVLCALPVYLPCCPHDFHSPATGRRKGSPSLHQGPHSRLPQPTRSTDSLQGEGGLQARLYQVGSAPSQKERGLWM